MRLHCLFCKVASSHKEAQRFLPKPHQQCSGKATYMSVLQGGLLPQGGSEVSSNTSLATQWKGNHVVTLLVEWPSHILYSKLVSYICCIPQKEVGLAPIDATPLPMRKRGVKRGREEEPPAVSVCVCVYCTLVQVPCISIGYQEICPHTNECESPSAMST